MNQTDYNKIVSFIWNIANDVLVHAFEAKTYKDIIMPMLVLRRIDVLLEPTKQKVLERKAQLEKMGLSNMNLFLSKESGYPFYNTSQFTLKTLINETDPNRLKLNFKEYINGYSEDVLDILNKFHMGQHIDNLHEVGRLGSLIEKFTSSSINLSILPVLDDEGNEVLPGLDNHSMGMIFEELLRRFNESNDISEAGQHFTPRDYVRLLADLAVMPIAEKLDDKTPYSVYDAACGTGGILSIAQERINEIIPNAPIRLFGQELLPGTYATCKADMMITGNLPQTSYQLGGNSRQYISFGSTISQDGHPGETFDFCISNPPFGTPWKEDLRNRDLTEKQKDNFKDSRFQVAYDGESEFSFIPNIGDCQMLFLANNVSRMKHDTPLGSRIVEIHNGSSLFTGNAGGGESNLRRYIIENDMLEAVVAMPENMFYNTGIGTYVWIVTNRKAAARRGKVQLINATAFKTPLRKNLGHKNCELSVEDRARIVTLLMNFEENELSRIFPNEEFGYWEITVNRPLRQSVTISKERLQKLVNSLVRKDVILSGDCADILSTLGIHIPIGDDTPRLGENDSIFDAKFAKFRSIKLPKTLGQLRADAIISLALPVLCDMMAEKELWLNMAEFEKRFNNDIRIKPTKLTWAKINLGFYPFISAEVNPKAEPVLSNNMIVPDPALRDKEQVPLLYPGGIEAFMANEVLPYAPDAYVDEDKTVIGYSLSFTKYFYKPVELRPLADIRADIQDIENRTAGMLTQIFS